MNDRVSCSALCETGRSGSLASRKVSFRLGKRVQPCSKVGTRVNGVGVGGYLHPQPHSVCWSARVSRVAANEKAGFHLGKPTPSMTKAIQTAAATNCWFQDRPDLLLGCTALVGHAVPPIPSSPLHGSINRGDLFCSSARLHQTHEFSQFLVSDCPLWLFRIVYGDTAIWQDSLKMLHLGARSHARREEQHPEAGQALQVLGARSGDQGAAKIQKFELC